MTNVGRDKEEGGPLRIVDSDVDFYHHSEKNRTECPQKFRSRTINDVSNASKEKETCLCAIMLTAIIFNWSRCRPLVATWVKKSRMWTDHEMSLSLTKREKMRTTICDNMGEAE